MSERKCDHCSGRLFYDKLFKDWLCINCGRGTRKPVDAVKVIRGTR